MPQPTSSDVHVDRPLTQISVAFMQEQTGFVANRVFPTVPVAKQSDLYFVYRRSDWHRNEVKKRAPATESAGSGWNVSTDSYRADVFAVHKDVDEQIRANSDDPINMDRDATEWVTQQHMLNTDLEWVDAFFKAGVWATDVTPATLWDDPSSDPIGDVSDGVLQIAEVTGFRPNRFVMSAPVWKALKNHPDILDRIKYTQTGIVTTQLLAALFDVEEAMVTWGVHNTGTEGDGNEDSTFIAGKNALLAYANPRPSILKPSAGYTFGWTGLLGAAAAGAPRIKRIPVPLKEADRIEGETAFDQKLVSADLGYFFDAAVG